MKILFGDLDEKLERNYISKPTIGNRKIHEDNNDNGVRIFKYAT
jgi:hypothetical protein